MKAGILLQLLLPVVVLLLHLFIILFLTITILRKINVFKQPLDGIEYSQSIFASLAIISVMLVGSSHATAVFQAFKTYQNQPYEIMRPFISKSSQFFLIILFFEGVYALIIFLITKLYSSFRNTAKQFADGGIPSALILGCISVGFAIAIRVIASETMEYVTPQYINFR